jgi:hypothetical protein
MLVGFISLKNKLRLDYRVSIVGDNSAKQFKRFLTAAKSNKQKQKAAN